jgi:mannose-6-phosphate isomerase-like protein (cupin superfamily)
VRIRIEMEIYNKSNSKNTGELEMLTSHMLISSQNSSTQNLSIQISEVPIGSEQPIHSHKPEQCYYIVKGKGLMIIEDESKEVSEGDAIYIPPNHKHGIKNIGNASLEYLTANSPVFSKEYEDSLWPAGHTNN